MKLPILYEDDQLIVVDKPAGMLVHGGNGTSNDEVTVASFLSAKIDDAAQPDRPGIVHRLDRDTSGVLVVARTSAVREHLQRQFKQRSIEKTYIAAVSGHMRYPKARIEVPLSRHPKNPTKRAVSSSGKIAVTEYEVIEERDSASLLKLKLLTGRTHQLRVHLQHLNHPILGDTLYGKATPGLRRQFLHASSLAFTHPNGERMTFESPLPKELFDFWYNEAQ